MKVALVHDWLIGLRGGERVLLEFLELYPEADIFTLLHVQGATDPKIDARVKETSWLNSIPNAPKIYRHLLPLYPFAAKSLHLSGYDLVISLSHAAAKNVSVAKPTKHLCYCFTPMRYIWDQASVYFGWKTYPLSPLIGALRCWDKEGAQHVDAFASISTFIRARIRCFYKRDSTVIFPPVRTDWIKPISSKVAGEAFLYAGALVPYKRADIVIDAFKALGSPLWVVGDGPLRRELSAKAAPNIQFLGSISDRELGDLYHRCRALVFPGVEDFGMIPVECMAAGRPVIGIMKGGVSESVSGLKHWEKSSRLEPKNCSGVFINPNGINLLDSLLSSLEYFEQVEDLFDPAVCRSRARLFSPETFQSKWSQFLQINR